MVLVLVVVAVVVVVVVAVVAAAAVVLVMVMLAVVVVVAAVVTPTAPQRPTGNAFTAQRRKLRAGGGCAPAARVDSTFVGTHWPSVLGERQDGQVRVAPAFWLKGMAVALHALLRPAARHRKRL